MFAFARSVPLFGEIDWRPLSPLCFGAPTSWQHRGTARGQRKARLRGERSPRVQHRRRRRGSVCRVALGASTVSNAIEATESAVESKSEVISQLSAKRRSDRKSATITVSLRVRAWCGVAQAHTEFNECLRTQLGGPRHSANAGESAQSTGTREIGYAVSSRTSQKGAPECRSIDRLHRGACNAHDFLRDVLG